MGAQSGPECVSSLVSVSRMLESQAHSTMPGSRYHFYTIQCLLFPFSSSMNLRLRMFIFGLRSWCFRRRRRRQNLRVWPPTMVSLQAKGAYLQDWAKKICTQPGPERQGSKWAVRTKHLEAAGPQKRKGKKHKEIPGTGTEGYRAPREDGS